MEQFTNIINSINSVVWSTALVILCLGAGLYFSIRMGFPQIRLFKEMLRLLTGKNKSKDGITPFQAFATTVGSRVGMGNIAGVATAIYFGGPGAVFWMWVIAFVGAGSAFVESSLSQAYKTRVNGEYVGGPAYFIEKGLKFKPLAIAFALATVLGPGILMPGLHVQSISSVFENAFGVSMVLVGFICCAVLGLVICGGIKRIGKVAELIAPIMCVVYVLMAIGVLILNIEKIPAVFGMIFSSAFGANQAFAGIIGSTIAWGVKRGVYSNEAGQGSGAIVSAAAECSHPAKQGLIQAFSVYIDTLLVCTASALIILLTDCFNVIGPDSETFLVSNIPSIQYGVRWAQEGLMATFGLFSGKLMAIVIVMFVFTSLMGYYYQTESNITYLFKGNKMAIWGIRIIFLIACFFGVIVNGEVVWAMGDIGAGLMAWFNIIAILLLSKKAFSILKDYETQKKQGLDPIFNPDLFEIEDEADVWRSNFKSSQQNSN